MSNPFDEMFDKKRNLREENICKAELAFDRCKKTIAFYSPIVEKVLAQFQRAFSQHRSEQLFLKKSVCSIPKIVWSPTWTIFSNTDTYGHKEKRVIVNLTLVIDKDVRRPCYFDIHYNGGLNWANANAALSEQNLIDTLMRLYKTT